MKGCWGWGKRGGGVIIITKVAGDEVSLSYGMQLIKYMYTYIHLTFLAKER